MLDTQKLAYDSLRRTGNLAAAQAMYLHVFMSWGGELTHRMATAKVLEEFGKTMPARNSRISELERMGFLRKCDPVWEKGAFGAEHRVTTWIWTGRTTPLPVKSEWVKCQHCEGLGGKVERVYLKEGAEKQGEMEL